MASYCEECFEEMRPEDARCSRLCGKCRVRHPLGAEIQGVYDKGRFGLWDHLIAKKEVSRALQRLADYDCADAASLRVRPHRDQDRSGPSREALGEGRPAPGSPLEHDGAGHPQNDD